MPASLSPRVLVSLTAAFIAAVFVFAGVYTATQHNPTPHQLRVGIVAPDLMVGIINTGLKIKAPGYFSLRQYPSEASLTSAIKDRKVYGGYVYRKDSGLLLTASAAGKAARYTLALWDKLTIFLEYPVLELSNNLAENSMRPVAIGRRNWVHIGSKEAGPKVAAIFSIVESCRRLGLPIRRYLAAVLPGLANRSIQSLDPLTPAAYAASKAK